MYNFSFRSQSVLGKGWDWVKAPLRLCGSYLTSESTFWLGRRQLHWLSKRQSMSTTALFRTMLTQGILGRLFSIYLWNESWVQAFDSFQLLMTLWMLAVFNFNYLWISLIIDWLCLAYMWHNSHLHEALLKFRCQPSFFDVTIAGTNKVETHGKRGLRSSSWSNEWNG